MQEELLTASNRQIKIEQTGKVLAVLIAFFLPISTTITDILFLLAPIVYFLSCNFRAKINVVFSNRIALILTAFYAIFTIGTFYTKAPLFDAIKILAKYDKFLISAFLIPIFIEDKYREYAIKLFIGAMGFSLLLSYLKFFGVIDIFSNLGNVEVFKEHISFNFLMSFLAYLLLLNISKTQNVKIRIFLGVFLCLVIFEVLFIGIGRSGYITFFALLTLFFLQKMRKKGILLAFLGSAILIGSAYYFSPIFKSRIHEAVTEVLTYKKDTYTSLGLRIDFYRNSLNIIKNNPWFGAGTGSFKSQYAAIKPAPKFLIHNPHNEYLNMGVQFGVTGILLLLSFFSTQLYMSFKLPKGMREIALSIVLVIMIGSLANSWLLDTTPGHFYAYFMAVAFAALPRTKVNKDNERGNR